MILGGGLTGISTAVHLRAPWLLFEREERLGGHARTDERDGYRFDKTGHWLHLRDPAVKKLVDELLPGQMVPIARRARIFSHGVLTRYPYQANLYGLPPEVIKECLLGVVEAQAGAGAGRAGPAAGELRGVLPRHFGAGISKHFMIPYNEKLWGVHPREITAAWCSRFVPLPNLEQVIAGAVGAGPPEMGYNQSFLYPKSGGIETFTRALQTRMAAGRVHTRASPDAVDWRRREVTVGGERFKYRALVATIPLPELLKRMTELPPEIETAGRAPALHHAALPEHRRARAAARRLALDLRARGAVSVLPRERVLDRDAQHGPAGVRVDLRRDGRPRADHRRGRARHARRRWRRRARSSDVNDVVFAEPKQIEYAYVVFDQHYYEATRVIFAFLEQNAIHPRGRYGAWTYNAMEDCVLAGREVAALIDSTSTWERRRERSPAQRRTSRSSSPSTTRRGSCAGRCWSWRRSCARFGWSYELLLCENGSRDRTVEIGEELQVEHPQVRMLSVGEPNYGKAMKQGILRGARPAT